MNQPKRPFYLALCTLLLAGLLLIGRRSTFVQAEQPAAGSVSHTVTLTTAGFVPDVLTVTAGDTVTWLNATEQSHVLETETNEPDNKLYLPLVIKQEGAQGRPATMAAGPNLEDFAGPLLPGGYLMHTFTTPGEYPYHLADNPDVNGLIIVQPRDDLPTPAPTPPPSATPPPPPTLPPPPPLPANEPPSLDATGNQVVPLGSRLDLTLTGSDPDGDPFSFSISLLPANASLNGATGTFSFRPAADQVGTHEVTFLAVDEHGASDSETITITVPAPDPDEPTTINGQLLALSNVTGRAPNGEIPLVGGTIHVFDPVADPQHDNPIVTTTTGADGQFQLTIPDEFIAQLERLVARLDASTAQGGPFPYIQLPLPKLVANVNNFIPTGLLPVVGDSAMVQLNQQTELLANEVDVTVAANLAVLPNGTLFNGRLDLAVTSPGSDPLTRPVRQFILGANAATDVIFNHPGANVTLPNSDNLPSGTPVDIYMVDAHTGIAVKVAEAQASGTQIVIPGGEQGLPRTGTYLVQVRALSIESKDAPLNFSRETCCEIVVAPGASAGVHRGDLTIVHGLPGHRSLEQSFQPALAYNNQAANGQGALPFNLTIPGNVPAPNRVALSLEVAGLGDRTYYVDTSALNSGDTFYVTLPVDGRNLPTGRHAYKLTVTSLYDQSSTNSSFTGSVFINNQASSSFGAGVTLAGVGQLHAQTNGDVIFTGGDGSSRLYERIPQSPCLDHSDTNLLARFDLNGNTNDGSGHGRHAVLLGGTFEATSLGQGLRVGPGRPAGFDWSAHAHLLRPPYTVEMILTADEVTSWQKLFGFDDNNSWGWYLRQGGFRAFPYNPALGEGTLQPGTPHYLAVVVINFTLLDVFIDGNYVGTVRNPVPVPPPQAIFFQDDVPSGGSEQFEGVIDCLRISRGARGPEEIEHLQRLLAARLAGGAEPGDYLTPAGDFRRLVMNEDDTFTLTLRNGTRVAFDAAGRQTAVTDRNHNTTTYGYTGNRLAQITDPVGIVTGFTDNDGNGLIDAITNANRTTLLVHDGTLLTTITNADDSSFHFFYDGNGQPTYTLNERGFVTQYHFNGAGQFSSAARSDLSTIGLTAIASRGLMTKTHTADNPATPVLPGDVEATYTDANDDLYTFRVNDFGLVVAATDPLGHTTVTTRDGNNNIVSATYANGRQDTATFDDNGNPVQVTYGADTPLAQPFSFTYAPLFNLITSIVNPAGDTLVIERDERGNATTATDFAGGVATVAYNGAGLPTSITNQNGQTMSLTYNNRFNVATITLPGGLLIELAYDTAGNVSQRTESAALALAGRSSQSRTTTYTYDVMNRLTSITDPTGATTYLRYDAAGNVVEVELATGEITGYEYDGLNRLIAVDDPISGRSLYVRDGNGNVIQAFDALGYLTQYEYDGRNRLTRMLDPLGNETLYSYDALGNLTALQDARGQTTTFSYDLLNRTILRRNPLEQETGYVYDSRNNLVVRTNPNGQTITYSYDALSRLLQVQTPDNTLVYTYDALGNRLSAEDDDSRVTFTYDARNRLLTAVTEHQPAVTLTYSYNAFGDRAGMTDSLGGYTAYLHDAAGRLTRLTTPAGDAIDLAYDPAGRLLETLFPNGLTTQRDYDDQGRLAALRHVNSGAQELLGLAYDYSDRGNIIAIGETRPGASEDFQFSFDPLQRLVAGGTEGLPEVYVYDENGNRTVSHLADMHDNDAANRLLEDETFTYSYDANANLVARTEKASGDITNYSYDAQNQLVQINFPNGSVALYRYDALGRRIEKNAGGSVTRMVYDGLDRLLDYDGNNNLMARYSHGPGIDNPLSLERDGQRYFYHTDHLGSVRLLSDAGGAVANRYRYDSYGRLLNLAEAVPNPFTYTGREFDAESGLYYYRLRYYDPQSGRFLSQDPLGFAAGDTNLYRYVGNNPLNRVDPIGLKQLSVSQAVALGRVLEEIAKRVEAKIAPLIGADQDYIEGTKEMRFIAELFSPETELIDDAITVGVDAQEDLRMLRSYISGLTNTTTRPGDRSFAAGAAIMLADKLAQNLLGEGTTARDFFTDSENVLFSLFTSISEPLPFVPMDLPKKGPLDETPPVELGNGECIL